MRFVTPALLFVGLALALRALLIARAHQVPLVVLMGAGFYALLLGLGIAVALVAGAAYRELRGLRRGRARRRPAASLRALFVVAVLGWLFFVAFVQPFQRIWFDLSLGVAAGAWALVVLFLRATGEGRLARVLGLTVFSLCAAAVGLELSLRVWAGAWPSPLNARVGAGPRELIRRFRCEPGLVRFGFACNSRGYYDTEFHRKEAADGLPLIVAIGDSFHVGTVPHPWHFTSICEELGGALVYNMGVPGIGPPEYLNLLVEEALPLAPDRILVSVFVGNDLGFADVLEGLPDAWLRAWLQRDRVLLFVLPARIARVRGERARTAQRRGGAATVREAPALPPMDREEAARAYPWVADPALEEPALSEETFLRLETERALAVCAGTPPSFDLFCEAMRGMQHAVGEIPLAVMLIPDEFQVEDGLWETVQERVGRKLDRTGPQRLLTTWLAEQGIPCLDLLPALREVPPGPDGQRHLYHRLDTHFNARGNEVTAEALAPFLRGDGGANDD